ncbi:MAG: diaminopimelate decarboxylase [Lachnospiraceae bacterium]|nr:diaminopimelate decarboxylase [Lachnospiraceae bacterium]
MERITLTKERAEALIEKYGSPLYVYDEEILRQRSREMLQVCDYKNFHPSYSIKANSNREIIKIVKEEGLYVDAMSPGEIILELEAGYDPSQILFVSNNISKEEMRFAIDKGVRISVDSVSQLDTYGQVNPGGKVCVRINSGIGAGHNKKVVTGGHCKFGVELEQVEDVKKTAAKYNLTINGINQHIGSLFLETEDYVESSRMLLETALEFKDLEFVDLGGGFGMPYKDENRLDIQKMCKELSAVVNDFVAKYPNKNIEIKSEPGRYVVAECCQLLGTVTSEKTNYGEKYIGCDIGFNVLQRPVMYDSYHNVVVYNDEKESEVVHLVGNICESGDILANARNIKKMHVGDIIGIECAGAYGYSMASNYNSRPRPAEVLITKDGSDRLIRKRDTLEEMLKQL